MTHTAKWCTHYSNGDSSHGEAPWRLAPQDAWRNDSSAWWNRSESGWDHQKSSDSSVVLVMVVVRGRVGGVSAPPPPRGLIAGNTRACSLPHTHWPSGSGVLFVKCPCRIVLSCLHSALARQVHPQSVSQDCQASMVVSLNSH